MTYAELQTDAAAYLHRTDLSAKMPGFVALAEASLFRELASLKPTQTQATGTTSGGLISLPADLSSIDKLTVSYAGTEMELPFRNDPSIYVAGGDVPDGYLIEGDSIRLLPAAGTGYGYTLYYTPKLVPLSDSVATNWLLTNAPDLYMYAVALEGARYVRNASVVALLGPMVAGLLDSVQRSAERTGQPTRGGLQIRARNVGGARTRIR